MKIFAYLHPELNILCCALLEESIPANVEVIEFEVNNTCLIIIMKIIICFIHFMKPKREIRTD